MALENIPRSTQAALMTETYLNLASRAEINMAAIFLSGPRCGCVFGHV